MAVERELRRLLENALRPPEQGNQAKNSSTALNEPDNQEEPTSPGVRVAVKVIYERLQRVCYQHALPSVSVRSDFNVPELLVLLAEAAVYQEDFKIAGACVEWFLSECRMKNQFYCRIQLVRAQCAAREAANDTGVVKLRKVLNAIHFVLFVVPVATDPKRRPHYDFLVYNASVTYWQIARQLMKRATCQFLLPSLTAIVDALKAVGEKDVQWLLRLQLMVVYAQIDAKQLAIAAKTVCDIVDVQFTPLLSDPALATSSSVRALYEEALRLQVHVGSFKDPECQKILANMKKSGGSKRNSLLTKLQALKSGAFSGTLDAALTELFQENTGMSTFGVMTTTDEDITVHLRGLDPASASGVDAEVLVEAGIFAAFRHEYRHAACCDITLQTKGKNVDPKFRVLHQVLKAILLALVPPPASANFMMSRHQRAALVVARRLEGVKGIERALLACKRQQDPTLIENVCLYAWNLSLPLLQPQSRDQLSRLFSTASSSLEELHSMQLNLRVRMMFELAKLELSADFISKAEENVNKALGLDYGTIATTTTAAPTLDELFANEAKWMRRPLDVHLLPLRNRLDVKLAVEDPATCDEELVAAVEQLRDAKTHDQRKRQLSRVTGVLDKILSQSGNNDSPPPPVSIDLLFHLNGTSAFAWHELKDATVAKQLTREALRLFFSGEPHPPSQAASAESDTMLSDKSVMLIEVDLRFRLVELMGHELKMQVQRYESAVANRQAMKSGKKKSRDASTASRKQNRMPKDADAVDTAALLLLSRDNYALGLATTHLGAVTAEGEVDVAVVDRRAAMENELLSLKTEIIQELSDALRASTRIGWGFVIENSAVYLWNYHFHVFRLFLSAPGTTTAVPSMLSECTAAFEAALAALEALPATSVNLDLLASTSLGLALAHEKSGKLDKAAAVADAILKRQKASTAALPTANTTLPSIPLVLLKRFGELKVRIQLQQNAKDITPVDVTPQVKVVSFLEAMEVTFHQHTAGTALPPAQLMEKATGFFQKALAAWQPIANESLERVKNEALSLEEQQQHLELYCEIWVRLGCGAFRLQSTKQAMDCAERALVPITKLLKETEQRVWITEPTWKWLAIAELLCARSILTLLSGETAAWTLFEATLSRLVHSAQYATRAGAFAVVRKAAEVAWNAVVIAMAAVEAERAVGESSGDGSEASSWSRLLKPLRDVLKALRQSGSGRLVGEFGLLVLDVCEKANDWKSATQVAETLLHSDSGDVEADQMKDISTFHAIAVASLGDTGASGGIAASGGKGKDHDSLMQAKILRKIAFSSRRNPPAQLKALAAAHKELDGKPEEQALVLVEMAEWFYTHQFPQKEVDAHLNAAMVVLIRNQVKVRRAGLTGTSAMHHVSAGHSDGQNGDLSYSPLWFADKLIRVFTMRAMGASSMHLRWEAVRHAVSEVYAAWQCVVDIANEADLREKFKIEAQGNQAIEFDEWRVGKATAFPILSPQSVTAWLAFYLQHEISTSSRFYMPWVAVLRANSASESDTHSVANPLLTCSFLERLMELLRSFGAFELLLPVVCLSQVIYHALSPHKCRAMEIWIEFATYDALEKLNVPVASVPLQSGLELLLSSGDVILRELQQHQDNAELELSATMRHRALLQLSSVNVNEKVAQSVDLLLQFGFVRQAKVLLTMLHSVALRATTESETKVRCDVLSAQVHAWEGDEKEAIRLVQQLLYTPSSHLEFEVFVKLLGLMSERTPDKRSAIEELLTGERLAANAILSTSECGQLHQPLHSQAVVKYLTSLASAPSQSTQTPPSSVNVDLDAVCGLAQLKVRRATLLLQTGTTTASVDHALRVFREAIELLVWIEAEREHAHLKQSFALQLIAHASNAHDSGGTTNARHHARWLVEAREFLREALVLLEAVRYRTLEPECTATTFSFVAPLDVEIAELKLQIAALELRLEESETIVADQQMTWYTYEKESRRTIVDKWLDQTAVFVPIEREGSVARAFALAGAATSILVKCPESLEARGLAPVRQLQCQRLALYHSPVKGSRDAVHRFLWTRFTSAQVPHETWICATGGGTNARGSAGDDGGRTTPALSASASAASVGDDLDPETQQQLALLASQLESGLKVAMEKRHTKVIGVCAYELVQVYGCNQPLACARAILLHQSVVVSEQHMEPLVDTCLATTNTTRLHMNRCEQLMKRHTNAVQNSLPFQLSQLFLDQQLDIYKRMSVSVPMDTVLSALPTTTRVLSLQLSPDRCFLYAVLVGPGEKGFMMGRMECTTNKMELLSTLRERIRAWRSGMTKAILSGEDTNANDSHEFVDTSANAVTCAELDALEAEFDACITTMTEILSPLFAHSAVMATLESELPGNSLVLIVDRDLELLPLEALPAFDKADAITREFSIHLLYHRLTAVKSHPFRKDDVRVVVDPRGEDAGLHEQTLSSVVHQFTKKSGAAFTSWKDAVDHAHLPTTTDWQQAMLLRRGGGLVYAGPNRVLGSVLSLETLAGMNLANSCYVLILVDRAENQTSARRQSKIDSEKPRWERELEEDPYACALLCSLCGVNTVVLNQWTTTFHANRRLMNVLLGGLAKGHTIARALRKYPETVGPVVPTVAAPSGTHQRKPSGVGTASSVEAAAVPLPPPHASVKHHRLKNWVRFNTAVFGLGHLAFKASEGGV